MTQFKVGDKFKINTELAIIKGYLSRDISPYPIYEAESIHVHPTDGQTVGFIDDSGSRRIFEASLLIKEPEAFTEVPLLSKSNELYKQSNEISTKADEIRTEYYNQCTEYERTISDLRNCDGRILFTTLTNEYLKYGLSVANDLVEVTGWYTHRCCVFQIYFKDEESAKAAIDKVGDDRIVAAVKFESTIGL